MPGSIWKKAMTCSGFRASSSARSASGRPSAASAACARARWSIAGGPGPSAGSLPAGDSSDAGAQPSNRQTPTESVRSGKRLMSRLDFFMSTFFMSGSSSR